MVRRIDSPSRHKSHSQDERQIKLLEEVTPSARKPNTPAFYGDTLDPKPLGSYLIAPTRPPPFPHPSGRLS